MDLFEEEQQVYDRAASHIKSVEAGRPYDFGEFKALAKEYRMLLKLLRRMTKVSDRTSDDLHENNLDLIDKVHYDTLTGIYSRRYMEDSLEKSIRLSAQSGECLSVMMMDIDFFKRYNDTYGHSAGDDCLKAVAQALDGCALRAGDFVARYGGEEFVAVLRNAGKADGAAMAERMLEAVRGLGISHKGNEAAGYATISIGFTVVKPMEDHQFMDYIKRADIALYYSKQNGRNRYTYIEYMEDVKWT